MSSKTRIPALKALATSALFLVAIGVAPATAEVLKRGCTPAPCSDYAPVIAVPGGWIHDSTAEDRLAHMRILVPAGRQFTDSDRVISAAALPKRAGETIADLIKSTETGASLHFPGTRFIRLPDLSRGNGKEPFHLLLAERPNSGKFELSAVTVDTDGEGNSYFVTIWLGADDLNTLNAEMPLYQEILHAYG
jgi:hypothetical protein